MANDDPVTGMFDLLDAVEAAIKAADPAAREALARTIDQFIADFPGDFHWATGPQAPVLLHDLVSIIDSSCRPSSQSKPRPALRLVERTQEQDD